MQSRRKFIERVTKALGIVVLGGIPYPSFGRKEGVKLTILFTNDTQSQINPLPATAPKYAGMGGVQSRANLIQKIRNETEHVLLLDAGDFFQGSPYFDVMAGEAEIALMNSMQYDAACLGEHEFDKGVENLILQLSKANFVVLCANYKSDVEGFADKIKPYFIIEKGGIKIGILGIGTNPKNLCSKGVSDKIMFTDPLKTANETAQFLKQKRNCDFIICLSHLGLHEKMDKEITDKDLAKESHSIDLIIGGHSHSLLQKPLKFWNKEKKEILVVQAGWGGTHLGKMDYLFSSEKSILSSNVQTVEIVE